MELYNMKYVIAVAETGNFSQAAQNLYIGQSALSQQIAKLEQEFGVRLFSRGAHGVSLTEAGEEFVKRAREILQSSQALEAEMASYAGITKGTLNIGIITSLQCIRFGDLLAGFCSQYPNISANITQSGTQDLISMVMERRLDIAFVNKPLTQLPAMLNYLKLGEDYYELAVSAAHPLAEKKQISLKDIREERFIFHLPNQIASSLCWNACKEAGFIPHIVCRAGNPTTALYMVKSDLGIAFLPSEEFDLRKIDGIVKLKIKEKIIKEPGIIWRKDVASPLLDAMTDFAKNWRSL